MTTLVEHGVPVTAEDLTHILAMPEHDASIAALERRLLVPQRIAERDEELSMLLRMAASLRENGIVRRALASGVGVDYRDRDGDPLLVLAAMAKDDPLVQELLRRGADVTVRTHEHVGENGERFGNQTMRDYLDGLEPLTAKLYRQRVGEVPGGSAGLLDPTPLGIGGETRRCAARAPC